MNRSARRFDQLTWPEVRELAPQAGSTLVWPFGACEQHGPHLPLATDALFAERILDVVLADLDRALPIWRLPAQAIGFSPEHQSFPGTLSLSSELLIGIVVQLGAQLAGMGWQRLVLFNAHGGQIGLLQVAARELRQKCPDMAVLPCFLWSGVAGLDTLIPDVELVDGLHAGLGETALMLQLAPDLVGSSRPVDGLSSGDPTQSPPPGWSLEGAAPYTWLTDDLSPSGVIGDSRDASVALGSALEKRLVQHWSRLFDALLRSSWPPCSR